MYRGLLYFLPFVIVVLLKEREVLVPVKDENKCINRKK